METVWRDQTKASIDDCSAKMWMQWSQQATELQILRADAENRKKAGNNFYKMDEESIVTIREELSDDFSSGHNFSLNDMTRTPAARSNETSGDHHH